MNLTVALLETRRPLTLADIRRKVAGYGQDDPETARRMFERDKDDLRRLGVPVQTVPLDAFETEWGYRIDRREYAMPQVDLSVEEVTALAVALQVTGEREARLGLAKLTALAPDPQAPPVLHARVDADLDALDEVAEALVERRGLRFRYRSSAGAESVRTVDPYGVVQRRGAWYLVGRDHARDALRAFRMDRVVDRPRAAGEAGAYAVPADLDLGALVAGPWGEGTDVEVAFAPTVVWEAVHRGGVVAGEHVDGWVRVRFEDAEPGRLMPWLAGFGEEAEVLAPRPLRDEMVSRLRALAGAPAAGSAGTG